MERNVKRSMFRWAATASLLVGCGGTPTVPDAPAVPAPAAVSAAVQKVAGPAWESPAALGAMCAAALAEAEGLRKAIVAVEGARTWDNTLVPFNRMFLTLDTANGLTGVAQAMSPIKPVRDAAETCEQQLAKFSSGVGLDREVYQAVAALEPQKDARGPAAARFYAKTMRDFRRAGVDKDDATRKTLTTLNEEMVKVGQAYGKAVREDVRFILVDDVKQLEGLPQDFIDAHKPGKDGKIRITTDYPDFYPVQRYVRDAKLREALYRKFINRGFPGNKASLSKLLELRQQYATLLGFDTWAAYNSEDKMVRDTKTIDAFIKMLVKVVRPVADADLKVLLARKKKDDPKATTIETWDRFFYASLVREEQYAFDAKTVRPYFSFSKVKEGLFAFYGTLFNLKFERLATEPTWDSKVEAWAMYADGKKLGQFYLDMHPRDGKYKHAAVFPMQLGLNDGREPVATLVCNFPDPSKGDGKALMEHQQVVTFFHEFGHLIHHLLAKQTEWHNLAGINVEWDFAEVPSQLLEEWTWDVGVLQGFAKHVDTGAPIPAEMVSRMKAAKEFGKGVATMRQLFYAAFSFQLHNRDPKGLDLDAFSDEIYRDYSPYPAVPGSHIYSSFGHLVGYSSMYYTYQWSLVIAKDLFTRFGKSGLMDAGTAKAYRQTILEPGGGVDAAKMVETFLGRPYNVEAYKAWIQTPAKPVTGG
jgi:thimet oligopeptidase